MNNSEKRQRSPILYILLVLVLLLIVGGYQAINSVKGNINSVMGNINSVSGNIDAFGTQVSVVLNPTPTLLPDPVTIIHEVRSLARLETIQYSVEKVITAEVGQGAFGFLIGDRLLFVAHGEVIAGIDLEKLSPEDLSVVDGVLYVDLPAAEIFIATLDNDLSYVYDRETGLLTKGNIDLETLARQIAEKEIIAAALESGILLQAKTNAENYLWRLFNALGFPEIIFVQPTPAP